MPIQADIPALVNVAAQTDVYALADVPSQSATHGQRDVPTKGDYEVVAKCTRSASSHSSTYPAKKPRRSLTIELVKEFSSPRHASEVAGAIMEILCL